MKSLREAAGYSQAELAEIAGMTPLAVHRYEQFLYARPSTSYLAALSEITGIPVGELKERYEYKRHAAIDLGILTLKEKVFTTEAYRNHRLDGLREFYPPALKTGIHPYASFRYGVCSMLNMEPSAMAWCVLTCFHPAQLHEFERVGRSIPRVQRELLLEAEMPSEDVTLLNKEIRRYHETALSDHY